MSLAISTRQVGSGDVDVVGEHGALSHMLHRYRPVTRPASAVTKRSRARPGSLSSARVDIRSTGELETDPNYLDILS